MGAGSSQEEAPEQQIEEPTRKTILQNNDIAQTIQTSSQVKPPHNHVAILKDADSPVDKSPTDKLYVYDQLYSGVFLNKKSKRYWIDRKHHNNCFLVFARNLLITWADDSCYWQWSHFNETSDTSIDVAAMLNVCWLEVHGKLDTASLTPEICYEVVFMLMLKDPAYGWEVPVNIRLILPGGSKHEHKEDMIVKPRGRWIEISAGEFQVTPEKVGLIEYSLYKYEGGAWKRGLVIKGVAIRPKT